ncbi:Aspartate aminotransferase [Carpediemonas membranifera]|uniref:Aspartate aminotransferase n=1 Tax=Carpediemonas membranifera TaxID=201153 RepID=A0A8J6AUE6_9EUKA|nr:Aspartate aminotransferase [Carpediemonas membranifera]|eukprot:KAG9394981.1 Aspartate aminotransferase [Carpediemonas membranifera]
MGGQLVPSAFVSGQINTAIANSSWIRRMFEEGVTLREKLGAENVFDLSIGNPVLEPPQKFRDNLKKLAANPPPGIHRYMSNAGFPDAREEVAGYISGSHGIKVAADDVVLTCGAAGASNIFMRTVLEPGDEVIVLPPYFVEYGAYVSQHGGRIVPVPTDDKFMPDLDAIRAAITAKTRAIILNSPNNPTGVIYPKDIYAKLGNILRDASEKQGRPVFMISDEPYRRLAFDDVEIGSVLTSYENAIVMSSFSKDLGLAGERIGFVTPTPLMSKEARQTLVNGLIMTNRTLGYLNAPAIIQKAIIGATGQTVDMDWYRERRDMLYSGLVDCGLDVVRPQGAFFAFPKTPAGVDDMEFTAKLKEEGVLVVPGRGFGRANHVRLSYVAEKKTLEKALNKIQGVIRGLKK